MIKTARTFVFLFIFTIYYLLFTIPSAFAQTAQPVNLSAGRQDLHNYTQNVMIEVMSSMTCLIAGVDAIDPSQKCLGVENGKIGPVDAKGGALGVMGNLITMTFNPPFHTGDYVRYLASDFGITKHAYAQGVGFQSLNPLIEIWKAFRNIVYLLFVLVFILIGFAIMLRVHIDPRTVMTIENQIPKIIIGLILVTFSFAIAGLLIDLMWVLIYLSVSIFDTIYKSVFSGAGIDPRFANLQGVNALQAVDGIGGISGIATNASAGVGGFIAGLLNGPGGSTVATILLAIIGGFAGGAIPLPFNLGNVIGGLIGGVIGGINGSNALGFIGQVIAFLIFSLAMLFALFRLWFTLIKNYVMILLITVFSPFWILGSLAPGSKVTIGSFLRELASRLAAFPATIIMFMLGKAFIDIFEGPGAGSTFVPPLIGNPGDYKAIGALIGLGIILLTPDVVNMVRKFTLDFGQIGGAVGVGAGAVNPISGISKAGQFGMTMYYAQKTPVLGGVLSWMGDRFRGRTAGT